jgi:hypothetical protein
MTELEHAAFCAACQTRHASLGGGFVTPDELLVMVVGPRRRPNRGVWSVPQGRKTEDGGRKKSSDLPLEPFYLPYEFTSVPIETGNANVFGIDPEATTLITAGL